MPSTRKTGTQAAPKPQTKTPVAEKAPTPEAAPAASEPKPDPAPNAESLFDETPPEPPVAEQPPVDPAASSEPAAEDRPEGVDGKEEVSPPTAPEIGRTPDTTELDPVPPAAETPEPEAPKDQADGEMEKSDAAKAEVDQSSDAPKEVRFGQVVGLLHRLPLSAVLAYADPFAEKIEALTFTAPVQALQSRMRVSEGRCAPIYFTINDDFEPEHLLAGDDALSAAKAIGLEQVYVVLLYPEDAEAMQSYLQGKAGKETTSTEDDDIVWRSNGYHAT